MKRKLLTTTQAAERLGVNRATLQKAIQRKHLQAEKIGRDWFIEEFELKKYAKRDKLRPGPKPRK